MEKDKYLDLLDEAHQRIAKNRMISPLDGWDEGYNIALTFAMSVVDGIKAKLDLEDSFEFGQQGCAFCRRFDFTGARAFVENGFAHVALAVGGTSFPRHQQFNYCPVCGKSRYKEEANGR